MIVGNGDIAEQHGAAIDAADFVVRFNDCRSYGPGGTKTDAVAVCNTGRPGFAMSRGADWKTNPAVVEAAEIWCTRDSARFAAMRGELAVRHPELDDFCDDYSGDFAAFAAATGKRLYSVPAETHVGLDAALATIGAAPYVVPSSGLLVIADVLAHVAQPDDSVTIAGFGHQGWEWHPFAAEKRLVDGWAKEHRLMRLSRYFESCPEI